MDQSSLVRWCCPDGGPAQTPQLLRDWVVAHLETAHTILCARRDLPVLQAALGGRVRVPESGLVQPGTVWVEA